MDKEKQSDENEELIEQLDFNKPNFTFVPSGSHGWIQRGYYLVCKSCELEHAVWIGSEKIMVGIQEDGKPIFKLRD